MKRYLGFLKIASCFIGFKPPHETLDTAVSNHQLRAFWSRLRSYTGISITKNSLEILFLSCFLDNLCKCTIWNMSICFSFHKGLNAHGFFGKHAGKTLCFFGGSCLEIQKFQNSDISRSIWLPDFRGQDVWWISPWRWRRRHMNGTLAAA